MFGWSSQSKCAECGKRPSILQQILDNGISFTLIAGLIITVTALWWHGVEVERKQMIEAGFSYVQVSPGSSCQVWVRPETLERAK